jgi:uncharacterized membrane protein
VTRSLRSTPPSPNQSKKPLNLADRKARVTAILNHTVHAIAKHWLLIANTVMGLHVALPISAPVFLMTGHGRAAHLIYTLFRPLCHQLPERSFFLFGPQAAYTLEELEYLLGPGVPVRYVGSPALGYKVAICQRDITVYLAALLAGLAFALCRRQLRPLSIRGFVVLCIPIALDGFGQLIALWDSTWWSRVSSGAFFGIACIWLAYPHVEVGMNDVLRVTEQTVREREKP